MNEILLAAELCSRCKAEPKNRESFEKLVLTCRKIGKHLSRIMKLIPPTERRMVQYKFDGTGMIDINRTINSFCTYGKSIDNIIERKRSRATRELNLMIVYDDSNSMTSWWRKEYLKKKVGESEAPQTYAKISTISLIETFGREAGVDLMFYGSNVIGPLGKSQFSYTELIKKDGSGATRLDLALEKLIEKKWHKRGGKKYLVILTDGLPEVGRDKAGEDSEVQEATLANIKKILDNEVRILYVVLLTDVKLAFKSIGSYNAMSFAEVLKRKGITVRKVSNLQELPKSLFEGMKEAVVKVR